MAKTIVNTESLIMEIRIMDIMIMERDMMIMDMENRIT
jgi:hypothetical protein